MTEQTIRAQVVYAEAGRQTKLDIVLAEGTTVRDAIHASGIAAMISEGAVEDFHWGIFARKIAPDHVVANGDRIEIYRPLMIDPMEARRRRAR
ncbi:MAG: RnfH family protein [Pseudomonadota bacterium]|nr:RnfH family protein [Pseudomonadota bacterium]